MTDPRSLKSRTFARDRRTWLVTLVLGAVVWAGTSAWLNRRVALAERRPAGGTNDGRFVALAYDRVVPVPDGKNLDRPTLRAQLRALASAGWQPITLRDLRDAYRGAGRLPQKPVLLSFDEGYLATYESADPVLRELRWPAVMFLRTDRQENRDVSFLFWDRLRRMAQSGLWELASGDPAKHDAVDPAGRLPEEPPGATLIARRLELPAAPAWAPRGVEPLGALRCEADGDRMARERVAVPWLGFADDPVGANDPDASPFRIGRLRVDPKWSPEELLHRMELAIAEPLASGATDWVPGEGVIELDAGAVRLAGRPRAEIWIPSARWTDDWWLEARVRATSGEFWIVQPGSVFGREWRFGGAAGSLFVQERTAGRPPDVLARADFPGIRRGAHVVRIVRRGAGVSVRWDGRPIAATPVVLPDAWRGRVGLVAYGGEGEASLTVEHVALGSYAYRVQAVSAVPEAREVAALAADAEQIAALSPPWVRLDGTTIRESPFDRDLFRILGRRYAWDIVPTVAVAAGSSPDRTTGAWMRELPARIAREGWAGVRFDLKAVRPDEAPRWKDAALELGSLLRRSRRRLVLVTS